MLPSLDSCRACSLRANDAVTSLVLHPSMSHQLPVKPAGRVLEDQVQVSSPGMDPSGSLYA